MGNNEAALLAIKNRVVYDLKLNEYVWVNKLIYWEDELMILGVSGQYKASEYMKAWKLTDDEKEERKYTLYKEFKQWLDENFKEDR